MEYEDYLKSKLITDIPTGIDIDRNQINSKLFDFQKDCVLWALKRGRSAFFWDCGMGKTFAQLEWAKHVPGNVLILAPLAVAKQTIREGKKIGIDMIYCRNQDQVTDGITIANYEMLEHFDTSHFTGIVLDESSILKSFTGKIRNTIIESFKETPFRLACTATPAPNDYMELGNHSEFLGAMTRTEMLSMFFINDAGDTGKWKLKGHAESEYWKWLCSWAVMMRKPSDLGYKDESILPPLNYHDHQIKTEKTLEGELFTIEAQTLSERQKARKETTEERVLKCVELIQNDKSSDQWLIWCDRNDESALLKKYIDGAIEVKGSDKPEYKEKAMLDFQDGNIRIIISKPSIMGFGMNFQGCHNMAFVGLSDSYEKYYQAVRRCWRFGQEKEVNVHIITADIEGAVLRNIQRKEEEAAKMAENMVKHMHDINEANVKGQKKETIDYKTDKVDTDNWTMYKGDSVEIIKEIPDNSIHYSLFSPPFASLFTYSNSARDMGNCKSEADFMKHFLYLTKELHRIIMPGRLLSFHCMNLPATITSDGYIGIKDFRGDLIRIFQEAGFIYHSEVCIWKDPLVQAVRTKTLGLAHKQIVKDSAKCGQGLPDYIVTMKKAGNNLEPVSRDRGFEQYIGEMDEPDSPKTDDPRGNKYSHHVWQRYASPVWFDIRQTNTLNGRGAREEKDEKHMCPLQLDTIERCIDLWTNENDTVFSPFGGIGSEGYGALLQGRKFIGIELKESYYKQALLNLEKADKCTAKQSSLF